MVYFDKEKGDYVWLHYNLHTYNHLKEILNQEAWCFIAILEAKYTKQQIESLIKTCDEQGIDYVIMPASVPNVTEERMRLALEFLNSEQAKTQGNAIKEKYDYAWIKRVIDKKLFAGASKVANKSFPSFVSYIKSLGCPEIHSTDISRYYNKAKDKNVDGSLPWDYEDCKNDRNETNRRNRIALTFLDIMKEFGM